MLTLRELLNKVFDSLLSAIKVKIVRREGETIEICRETDISGGIIAELKEFRTWSMYLKVADAIDIKIELSPDGGSTWFEVPESPISFSSADDKVVKMDYSATHIRITGSNTSNVTAIVRGVY